jgi:uncharacterized RDD family membrane protein YckC
METPTGPTPESADASGSPSAALPPSAAPQPAAPPPPAAPLPPVSWLVPEDHLAGPAPGYLFGGAGERLIAYIVDSLIISGLVILVLIVGAVVFAALPALAVAIWIVGCVAVVIVYFPYFWLKNGQTPGLKLFHMRVVRDSDGGPIGFGAAILRLIGLYVIDGLVFYIGFVWIFIDKRKRCWHDLLAGTVVVKKLA